MEKDKKQYNILLLSIFAIIAAVCGCMLSFTLPKMLNYSPKLLPCDNCNLKVTQPAETHLEECGGCSSEFFTGCPGEMAEKNTHLKKCEHCSDTYYDCPMPLPEKNNVERAKDHGIGKCVTRGDVDLSDALN